MNPRITLRRAQKSDSRFLWLLRNEATVRRQSIASAKIDFDTHRKWLTSKLGDKNTRIWIVRTKQKKIGQVRFDRLKGRNWLVNIALVKSCRDQGIGALILRRAVEKMRRQTKLICAVAMIRRDNERSIRCFSKMGFSPNVKITQKGVKLVEYVLVSSGLARGNR